MLATIEWAEEKDRSRIFYRAATAADTDQTLLEAFDEVRRKLATDVLPKHTMSEWDSLRVEFWSDSGRLILYPGHANSPARSEKAGCELMVQSLFDFWERLVESDISDDEFGRRVRTEERRYAALLLKAWSQRASIAASDSRPIRVLFFEAEESTPFLASTLPASALLLQ